MKCLRFHNNFSGHRYSRPSVWMLCRTGVSWWPYLVRYLTSHLVFLCLFEGGRLRTHAGTEELDIKSRANLVLFHSSLILYLYSTFSPSSPLTSLPYPCLSHLPLCEGLKNHFYICDFPPRCLDAPSQLLVKMIRRFNGLRLFYFMFWGDGLVIEFPVWVVMGPVRAGWLEWWWWSWS